MTTRRCSKCERSLPESDFFRYRARADGLHTWCKACVRASQRAAASPVSHFVTVKPAAPAALPPEQALYFALKRLRVGEMMDWQGAWRITRLFLKFFVEQCVDGRWTGGVMIPPTARGADCEFAQLRAASKVVAHILGDTAAPELRYKNVTRWGNRFEAWFAREDHRFERPVVSADTAEAAYAEYRAWRSMNHREV